MSGRVYAFAVTSEGGRFVLGVLCDGSVQFGEGVTVDQASREFWRALAQVKDAAAIAMTLGAMPAGTKQ